LITETCCLQYPHSITAAPWVGANELYVAAEVDHLLLGERRIEVPRHGRLIVAWKSRSTGNWGLQPVARDGSELSRIGPHDCMDSYTWAKLSDRQELTCGLPVKTSGRRPGALTIRRPPWGNPAPGCRAIRRDWGANREIKVDHLP
jgi:hypothetical protein